MNIYLHVFMLVTTSTNMLFAQDYIPPPDDDYPCENCQYRYTSRGSRRGIFTSPGFPDAYDTKITCCYFFHATDSGRVRIEFDYFDLEPSDDSCKYDYIEIASLDQNGMGMPPKSLYCGTSTPPVYISAYDKLEIIFKSDVTTSAKGFLGHYEFLETNWHPFPLSTIGCGPGYLSAAGGSISSPSYPAPYPAHTGCTWIIQAQPNQHILLVFVALDISMETSTGSHCPDSNLLMLFEGFMTPDQEPVRYCGQLDTEPEARREYLSIQDRMVVRFQADRNPSGQRGFHLSWTAVTLEADHCNGFLCGNKVGAAACERTGRTEQLCNTLHYCIHSSMACNDQPNCGVTDNTDENKCLNFIMRYVGIIGGSVLVATILVIVLVVCCYRRRHGGRGKYTAPSEQSVSHSMTTYVSTQSSNNMPVASLDHSPRSSCVMYTTSFTDCAVSEHATPNHSSKHTLNSFKSTSNSNSLHPSNCTLNTQAANDVESNEVNPSTDARKQAGVDDVIHTPPPPLPSYQGHHKRPSYHMMQELIYDDGNMVLADI